MPYLILREAEPNGNKVVVSGLKGIGKINDHMHLQCDNNAIWFCPSARELAELKNFSPAPAASASPKNPTIAFPQPPCVVLNALEVLGFKVISSTTASDVIVWTLWDGIYVGFGFNM